MAEYLPSKRQSLACSRVVVCRHLYDISRLKNRPRPLNNVILYKWPADGPIRHNAYAGTVKMKTKPYKRHFADNDAMRTIAFICDMASTVSKALLVKLKKPGNDGWITIIFGAILGLATITIFVVMSRQDTKKAKTTPGCCASIYSNFLMMIATWCYYTGDNIAYLYDSSNPETEVYRVVSQILLLYGLMGFRFIPLFKINSTKCCSRCGSEVKGVNCNSCNCCVDCAGEITEKAKELHKKGKKWCTKSCSVDCIKKFKSMRKFATKPLTLAPEIDGWYTILSNITVKCTTSEYVGLWVAYTLVMIAIAAYLLASIPYKKGKKCECLCGCGSLYAVIVLVIIGCYLIADNEMPLNCVKSVECLPIDTMTYDFGPNCDKNNLVRLILSGIAVFIAIICISIFFGALLLESEDECEDVQDG